MTLEASAEMRAQGRLFESAAEHYQEGRPGYPPEVFGLLQRVCDLKAGARLLEIGAGTGQATLPLLQLGAQVTVVEPGAALTTLLVQRAAGLPVQVITATFEEATLTDTAFDMVVAATSFHWIDPQVGLPKIATVLYDGGWLALWWTVFGDPDRADPFNDALQPVLQRLAPTLLHETLVRLPNTNTVEKSNPLRDLEAAGLFTNIQRHVFSWEGRHTPQQLRALFATFSPWLALPTDQRVATLDALEQLADNEFSGLVVRPYQTFVYLAQRLSR